MFLKLVILFTVLPAIELYLLIKVGSVIGAGTTIAIIIITGVLGASLARMEGLKTLFEARREAEQGRIPADQLISGVLILLSAAVLATPGFITDAIGFSLLIPPIRGAVAVWVKKWLQRKMADDSGSFNYYGSGGANVHGAPPESDAPAGKKVIDIDPEE